MTYFKFGRGYTSIIESIGLTELQRVKEETTLRWSQLGLLDGLVGNMKSNIAQLYESQTSYIINEPNDISLFDR